MDPYSQIYYLSSHDSNLMTPLPKIGAPNSTANRMITIDISQTSEWPLTGKDLAGSQLILFASTGTAPKEGALPIITLDTAANLIPYFPYVHTGNIYRIRMAWGTPPGCYETIICGCTGSYLLGVTGSISLDNYVESTIYLRWDNVSGSTGSYTII